MGRPIASSLVALALTASIVAIGSPPAVRASGLVFTVNTTNDLDDGACDATHCSLREAINAANAATGPDAIHFQIIEAGPPHTIRPYPQLPTVTGPTIVDATTDADYAGSPVIELDGSAATLLHPDAIGLRLTGGNSVVRGLVINRFGTHGTISGSAGIVLHGGGNNVVEGNFLGTDITGQLDRGNGHYGLAISLSSNNVIGGTTPGQRNVLSGNQDDGVGISGHAGVATGNRIIGNYIGLAADGVTPLGNSRDGVTIGDATRNVVGGVNPGEGNVIGANGSAGVHFTGAGARWNEVKGNRIGTDATGMLARGNYRGVIFTAAAWESLVGGEEPGAGNLIAYNWEAGVHVVKDVLYTSIRIRILGNSIHSNGVAGLPGLGIELSPGGVNPNDLGDTDIGANRKMNFPVLTSAVPGAAPVVSGTLNSEADGRFRLEFFGSTGCDGGGNGEGELFLGALDEVLTDAAGNAAFTFTGTVPLPAGWAVTATSTEKAFGHTSEFSACIGTGTPPPPPEEEPNHAPALATIGDQWVVEGSALAFTLDATDEDGDAVTYAMVDGHATPGGDDDMSLDPLTGEFSWTPADNYSQEVTFIASDGQDVDTETITISSQNVAPSLGVGGGAFVTSYTLGGMIASASLAYSDVGWHDDHALSSFTWTVDEVSMTDLAVLVDTGDTATIPPLEAGTATSTRAIAPGCHAISLSGTIRDDDGGSSPIESLVSDLQLDVPTFEFLAPIKDGERNIARWGTVVPIRVRVTSSCQPGLALTDLGLYLTYVRGSAGEIIEGTETVTSSVSNADTDNVMRTVDSTYLYNLATRGLTANQDYTVRVRVGSTSGPIVLTAVLQPR